LLTSIKLNKKKKKDFILLDQIESFKKSSEVINQHVWSVDILFTNDTKLNKYEALDMLWNLYAILIVNNENEKPLLQFQTIEMIKGRIQQRK